jgi:hypothetical protein
MNLERSTVYYPSLKKPFSLVVPFLSPGDVLEDLETPGPLPVPEFKVTIEALSKPPNGPELHQKQLQSLPPRTILIYTDGSKLEDGHSGSSWSLCYSLPCGRSGPEV